MSLIIGASSTPAPTPGLPEPEVALPHPGAAPEAHRVLDTAALVALMQSESPLVRTFAVEQATLRDDPALLDAVAARVLEDDELVAMEAVSVLTHHRYKAGADAVAERFLRSGGELAAVCASALGDLAPERLLDAARSRGRMDDETFAGVATALGIIGTEDAVAYLDKALNRAGAVSPDRRGALYGAALLSGNERLAGRVLSLALADSAKDEPDNASFPPRAALVVLSGLPTQYSRQDAGLEVFDHARELLEAEVLPALPEEAQEALQAAMKAKRTGDVIAALAPVLDAPPSTAPVDPEDELGSMPRRRRGLLAALVARREALGQLDPKPGAVFVAAAAQAATVILAHDLGEATSPAMVAIAKGLEGAKSPAELADMDAAALAAFFGARSERELRRVANALVRQHFRRALTLRKFFGALFAAGHGKAAIIAAAEVQEPQIHSALARAATHHVAAAEAVVVEMLQDRETEAAAVPLLLQVSESVRTERVALALGRRFFALRPKGRARLARACLRTGDARLLPLLESRAFPDEAEEVAWVVLSLIHQRPVEGKLAEAVQRTLRDREEVAPDPRIRVPMTCTACQETNTYLYNRAFVDVEAKDEYGDPAFAGDQVCKACGATDTLVANEETARVLTSYMMELLQAAQAGLLEGPPPVSPAQTEVGGRKMGLAAALRVLKQEIEASPDAVRPRLQRARLLILLERSGAQADLDAALRQAPDSPEVRAMEASLLMRSGRRDEAMTRCAEAVRALTSANPPRLYDAQSAARLQASLEDYMAELEAQGAPAPEGVDLTGARARLADFEAELVERRAAQRAMMQGAAGDDHSGHDHDHDHDHDHEHGHEHGHDDAPAAERRVGRNDPCPCGSGKKYKKCHGARG
jgi:hypothetical protein